MSRTRLVALLAGIGFAFVAAPTQAQYYPYPPQRPYYPPEPRPYYPPQYRPDPYGGYRPYRPPVPVGNLCVTSRGNCYTRPRPDQSPCSCNIPGFGPKRGAIYVAPGRW